MGEREEKKPSWFTLVPKFLSNLVGWSEEDINELIEEGYTIRQIPKSKWYEVSRPEEVVQGKKPEDS